MGPEKIGGGGLRDIGETVQNDESKTFEYAKVSLDKSGSTAYIRVMSIKCYGCHKRVRLSFGIFCTQRCAAAWADGMTESYRFCPACDDWEEFDKDHEHRTIRPNRQS